jgi:hypothetical protein
LSNRKPQPDPRSPRDILDIPVDGQHLDPDLVMLEKAEACNVGLGRHEEQDVGAGYASKFVVFMASQGQHFGT